MTFQAGMNPKTGDRAKRAVVYDFLRARPCVEFTMAQLQELTGVPRSTLWSTLGAMTQVRETAEKYPHVHKVGPSRFVFDPSLVRGQLPTLKQLESAKARKRRDRRAVPVVKGSVSQVSESVFGLKPVKDFEPMKDSRGRDVRVMQDSAGQRYVVTVSTGRTEIVEI